jgi:aminopeptidase N
LVDCLQEFYAANKEKPLVLLKWLAVQASCALPNNLPKVKALMEHPAFTITTPNCCYSLFLGFARSVNFHAADGSGYKFIGDSVIKVGSAVAVLLWGRGHLGGVELHTR